MSYINFILVGDIYEKKVFVLCAFGSLCGYGFDAFFL